MNIECNLFPPPRYTELHDFKTLVMALFDNFIRKTKQSCSSSVIIQMAF